MPGRAGEGEGVALEGAVLHLDGGLAGRAARGVLVAGVDDLELGTAVLVRPVQQLGGVPLVVLDPDRVRVRLGQLDLRALGGADGQVEDLALLTGQGGLLGSPGRLEEPHHLAVGHAELELPQLADTAGHGQGQEQVGHTTPLDGTGWPPPGSSPAPGWVGHGPLPPAGGTPGRAGNFVPPPPASPAHPEGGHGSAGPWGAGAGGYPRVSLSREYIPKHWLRSSLSLIVF